MCKYWGPSQVRRSVYPLLLLWSVVQWMFEVVQLLLTLKSVKEQSGTEVCGLERKKLYLLKLLWLSCLKKPSIFLWIVEGGVSNLDVLFIFWSAESVTCTRIMWLVCTVMNWPKTCNLTFGLYYALFISIFVQFFYSKDLELLEIS